MDSEFDLYDDDKFTKRDVYATIAAMIPDAKPYAVKFVQEFIWNGECYAFMRDSLTSTRHRIMNEAFEELRHAKKAYLDY